jgi:RimJ/RimL family protein N-acetyltransferase
MIAIDRETFARYNSRMLLTIRPARLEDAPVLAQAERAIAATPGFLASQPAELTDERFAQKIVALAAADNGRYLVAESEGQVVGHGLLDPLPLAAVRHVVHLTLVAHPGWQGKGIGRALLGRLIEWAKSAPVVEKIELNVRSSNAAAQALYLKMGFTEMGRWKKRIKVAPGQYLDDVAMELFVK